MKNKTIKYVILVLLLFLALTCIAQAAPTMISVSSAE